MKSILLHVYEDTGFDARLNAACGLARATQGHLTCVHATPFEDYLATDPLVVAVLPEEFSRKMERHRQALQERVEAELRAQGVCWDWIHVDSLISDALIRFAALADVAVVSQAGPSLMKDEPRPLAAEVAIGSRTPVLAVPADLAQLDPYAPALVAWNGSTQCANALRWSLPMLRMAKRVHVLTVADRLVPYPSDVAARYLSRHGIEPELLQRPPADDVASAIVAAARELGAGLLVMGAYGHSRLREWILGGVTRTLVPGAPLPLLLAH
jgi:nucleotide-binding universal stress UspA family protein